MKSDHIDIDKLGRYLSNRLTTREEDLIQEHLHNCPECSQKLKEMRSLHDGFFNEKEKSVPAKKRMSSGVFFKVAASLILLVGATFFIYNSIYKNTDNIITPHTLQQRELDNPVFSVDSVEKKDTANLHEELPANQNESISPKGMSLPDGENQASSECTY